MCFEFLWFKIVNNIPKKAGRDRPINECKSDFLSIPGTIQIESNKNSNHTYPRKQRRLIRKLEYSLKTFRTLNGNLIKRECTAQSRRVRGPSVAPTKRITDDSLPFIRHIKEGSIRSLLNRISIALFLDSSRQIIKGTTARRRAFQVGRWDTSCFNLLVFDGTGCSRIVRLRVLFQTMLLKI